MRPIYTGLLCCLFAMLVSYAEAQGGETLWCFMDDMDVSKQGMPIPNLPEQYSTDIQLNFENKHFSSEVTRTVDKKFNRSTIEIWDKNRHVKYISLENENAFLTINYGSKEISCSVKKITGTKIMDLYLDKDKVIVAALIGLERLITSKEAIFMSTGPSNVKGIYVQQWQTCAFMSEVNEAIGASISFADPVWTTSHPEYPTPVPESNKFGILVEIEMKIPGKLSNSKDFTDIIMADFSRFLPFSPADDEFQPPEDAHCSNFRTAVKRPPIPNYFRYSAEVMKHIGSTDVSSVVSHKTIYYDYKANLVRVDLQEPSERNTNKTAPLGTVVASIIRDFKAGIEYMIDLNSGSCSIKAITGSDDVFGTTGLSDEGMLDPSKYFYLNSSQISYIGQFSNRGMMTDVFSSLIKIKDQTRKVRWYFAADKVQLIEDQRVQKNVLVKMVSTAEASTGKDGMIEMNFYNFVEREPSLSTYDVAFCYNNTLSKTFILSFPGDMNPFMVGTTNLLKEKVQKAIKQATGLSNTRISVREVILTSSHMYAQFILTDVLPLVTKEKKEEITLNEAVNKLQAAISNRTLSITMPLKDNIVVVLRPDASGLKEYSTEEKTREIHQGFAQSSVVGLAFGMILLGFLIGGVVVNLIISRKHGVSLFQKDGFGSSAKSFENPLNESSM